MNILLARLKAYLGQRELSQDESYLSLATDLADLERACATWKTVSSILRAIRSSRSADAGDR